VDTDRMSLIWEANRAVYGRIKYGTDRSQLGAGRTFMNARKRREVILNDLKEGTMYVFKIKIWDASGKHSKTKMGRFRTAGMPEPAIKEVRVKDITRNGAVVRWVTNVPTTALFESGHDSDDLGYKTRHEHPGRHHQVELDHFYPDMEVYYRITVTDTRGRTARRELNYFWTRENNIALDKPVSGTFGQKIYKAPSGFGRDEDLNQRITDGDFTFMGGTATSGDPADTDQWFVVDFKELVKPDTVVIYWFAFASPRQYEIQGSVYGEKWRKLAGDLNAGTGERLKKGGIDSLKHKIHLNEEKEFQYIRVFIPAGAPYYKRYPQWEYVQIQEFKLFPKKFSRGGDLNLNHPVDSR